MVVMSGTPKEYSQGHAGVAASQSVQSAAKPSHAQAIHALPLSRALCMDGLDVVLFRQCYCNLASFMIQLQLELNVSTLEVTRVDPI